MPETIQPVWSGPASALIDAAPAGGLLARGKQIIAVDAATGRPQGAAIGDTRLPWPFLVGNEIWRSRKAGLEICSPQGGSARKVKAPKPTASGSAPKPGYFSSTPEHVYDDFEGEHACRTWTVGDGDGRGDAHWLVRYDQNGAVVSSAAFQLPGAAIRGIAALPLGCTLIADAGDERELLAVVRWDGSIAGQTPRATVHGTADLVKWRDLCLVRNGCASDEWLAVDSQTGTAKAWKLPGVNVRVIDEELLAFGENTIARIDAKGRMEKPRQVLPLTGYPWAYFAAPSTFLAGPLIGLPIAAGPSRIFWVDASQLEPAGESPALECGNQIRAARMAGEHVVLHDGRTAYAFRLAELLPRRI